MLGGIISSKSRDRKICFSHVKVGWGRKVGYVEITFEFDSCSIATNDNHPTNHFNLFHVIFQVLETQKMMLFLHSQPTLLMS